MKRITIKDVAKLANVSTATVSHVINDTRHVSEKTHTAVTMAMGQLGYMPNTLARSLRSGETKTIGLIVPDASNLFFAEIARRIEDFGYKKGYSVILGNSDNDSSKQLIYINTLAAKQVDGVIFISTGGEAEDLLPLRKNRIPIVVADRDVPLDVADVVLIDNEKAGYDATTHLIQLGHIHIGCITGPNFLSPSMDRVNGYKRAIEDNNILFNKNYLEIGDFKFRGGQLAMSKLLSRCKNLSAVFVTNDMMAIGAINAAREFGLRIPDDISIIGFDDIEIASAMTPTLTTISQPIKKIAEIATTKIIDKIHADPNQWKNQKLTLEARLIVRNSTKQKE